MKNTTILIISLLVSFNVFASGFMPVANIIKIKGEAFINKEKISEGAEVATGMTIDLPKKGDFVEIKFQNGHLVRFTGATVFVELITPKETFFKLIKGKLFSVVKALTEGEKFTVKTQHASYAVRGTKFFIEVERNKSFLFVGEGVVTAEKDKSIIEVRKDHDLFIEHKSKLKVQTATKQMIKTNNVVFEDMGLKP